MEDRSIADITEKFESLAMAGEPSGTQQQGQLPSKRKIPKVALPEPFKGVKSQYKMFKAQVNLYMVFNRDKFSYESEKVMWTISYLQDTAFAWIKPYLEDFTTHKEDKMKQDTINLFSNIKNFWTEADLIFGDIEQERNAVRKLQSMRQKGAASSYAGEFRQYAVLTDRGDSALRDDFYKGLKEAIKDDISRLDERPKTLEAMIKKAIEIDNYYYKRALKRKGQYSPSTTKGRSKEKDLDTMD